MVASFQSQSDKPRFYSKLLREFLEFTADVLLNTLIIIGLIMLLRFIFISPFEVNGSSMVPTLEHKDYILVNKFICRLAEPARGDIVVLIPPHSPNTFYVKRIIGLPQEKLEFKDDQVIVRNKEFPTGIALEEDYLLPSVITRLASDSDKIINIPADHYFVLGDNRSASNDSRSWIINSTGLTPDGSIARKQIVGKAWLNIYPFEHFKKLPDPSYSR